MESKELKIQAPEGYEIDKENSTFECIKFKPIKENIGYEKIDNSIFFNKNRYYIGNNGTIICTAITNYCYNKNSATNKKQLEKLLALNQLLNIAEYYNKLHTKHNNCYLYYISFEKLYGYSVRPHYIENDWLNSNSVVAFFNKQADAQAVIDNPNFREILDTIYK